MHTAPNLQTTANKDHTLRHAEAYGCGKPMAMVKPTCPHICILNLWWTHLGRFFINLSSKSQCRQHNQKHEHGWGYEGSHHSSAALLAEISELLTYCIPICVWISIMSQVNDSSSSRSSCYRQSHNHLQHYYILLINISAKWKIRQVKAVPDISYCVEDDKEKPRSHCMRPDDAYYRERQGEYEVSASYAVCKHEKPAYNN